MSHTLYFNGCCATIGNSDWSGDVTMRFPQDAISQEEHREELKPFLKEDGSYSVPVPGSLLKSIAAQIVRESRIAALEQASNEDIFQGRV